MRNANFTGDKRRLLELAGVSPDDIEKILTEATKCKKCDKAPCACEREEQEEVKKCSCV